MYDAPVSLFHPSASVVSSHTDPETDGRFLSQAQCRALVDRILTFTGGGGRTYVGIDSAWTDNLRWGRNVIATGGDTQRSNVSVNREIRHAWGTASTNALTDDALRRCVGHAEALVLLNPEDPDDYPDPPREIHPHTHPTLWFDRTVTPDEAGRASVVLQMIAPAAAANVQSAGFFEVGAHARSVVTSEGLTRYYPYTTAQCSLTVRDLAAHGSGWAGVDWNDVARIDTVQLAAIALDKCQRSRNPVAVEPGRFTVILEPQAVCDLVSPLIAYALDRSAAERGIGPFADLARPGYSRIGMRVVDPRLTVGADPMDPECGFVPFDDGGEPYLAVNWIEHGVLRALSYDRGYGLTQLGIDAALPNAGAFRLSGGTSTIEEMIASTTRGLLVTRLNTPRVLDIQSFLMSGTTRDGLWLIERGAITKSVKNMRFTESPMFVLNNIETLGRPQRVFRPYAPTVVPPILARDFSFTGLVDAV